MGSQLGLTTGSPLSRGRTGNTARAGETCRRSLHYRHRRALPWRRTFILSKTKNNATFFPDKSAILAFIREQPGKVGTREIARAFGLKNALRAELKRLLRDLADDGAVEKRHKKLHHPGALPSTVLADVAARARDGAMLATPDEWDEEAHGAAPKIRVLVPRNARRGEAPGLGDRVLLRVEEADEDGGIRHRGRVLRVIDRPKHRVLGIFRKGPRGGGRLEPVDKKMLGKELLIPEGATAEAQDGDLVAVEASHAGRRGASAPPPHPHRPLPPHPAAPAARARRAHDHRRRRPLDLRLERAEIV